VDTIYIVEPSEIVATAVISDASCNYSTSDGAIDITVSGGNGGYEFEWSNGATTEDLTGINSGSYFVNITDVAGCELSEGMDVGAVTVLPVDFFGPAFAVCPETMSTLFGPEGDSVRWEPAELFSLPNSDSTTVTFTSDVTISYTIFDNSGCYSADTVGVVVIPEIGIEIYAKGGTEPLEDIIFLNEGEPLELVAVNGTGMFSSYLWSPNMWISATDTSTVTISPLQNITYTVTGTYLCPESDSIQVVLRRPIKIYTGFSPNGDEYNPVWVIENAEQWGDKIHVRVFNRWGELIFETKGYGAEDAWDGTRNGRLMPVGSYYYIIDIKDGISKPYTGTVTILR